MSYRNKTYVIFNADYPDGEGDLRDYNMMRAWKANEHIEFDFYDAHDLNNLTGSASEETIKVKLRERMNNAKQVIVLVGEHTKNLFKFVRWEIEIAQRMDLPIIAVNLDKANGSTIRTPPILKENSYFLNVPYEINKIQYALDHFPEAYEKNKGKAPSGVHYNWSKINL